MAPISFVGGAIAYKAIGSIRLYTATSELEM